MRLFSTKKAPTKRQKCPHRECPGLSCATYGMTRSFKQGSTCCPRTVECTSCPSNRAFVLNSYLSRSGTCQLYKPTPYVKCTDMDKDSYALIDVSKLNNKICTKVVLETTRFRVQRAKSGPTLKFTAHILKLMKGNKGAYNGKVRAYCQVRKESYCRNNRCYVRKQVKCLKVCSLFFSTDVKCFTSPCEGKYGHGICLNVAMTA